MPASGGGGSDYYGGQGLSDFTTGQPVGAGAGSPLDPRYGGGHAAYPNQPTQYPSPGPAMRGGGGGADQQYPNRYKFSPEELKALRDCNKESFYYRCLPIGTTMGVGTYYAVRYGYLKPNTRFGAGPKMFAASLLGYFIGKLSYQSKCAEKLMALPNSQLGEMIRKQKGRMGFQETLSMEPGFVATAPIGGPAFSNSDFTNQGHVYSDVGDTQPLSSFDSEGGSGFSGYDYSQSNYDTTKQMLDDENLPPKRPQFFTSYDDLRRQNRIEYETKQHRNPSTPPTPAPGLDPSPPVGGYERQRQPNFSTTSDRQKNKYGDVWDDKPGSY